MGLFCTTTALDTLMPQTTFDTATTSLANQCITQAENEIRKRLSRRYDTGAADFNTTTGTVPPMVSTLCEWLSMGYIYESTSRGSKESFNRADRFIKKAMANMKDILERDADLVDETGTPLVELSIASQLLSNTDTYIDTFDEGNPLGWQVDSDKLSDIATSKK